MEEKRQERSVPVIEEELVTGTRPVQTGAVRVRKKVERTEKAVEMPVIQDVVNVTRVPVNRVVAAMPAIREEGDLVIVPVVEEELVIEKRLVLKEEIHIHRRQVKKRVTKEVTLGREHAIVERLDAEGDVVARSTPERPTIPSTQFKKRKSLLE